MARSAKLKSHQYKHAKKRLIERYDLWIDEKEYDRMIRDVQMKKASFLGRESNTRTHWMIDGYLIAVYDSSRQSIATFLPPEAINNYLPIGSFDHQKWKSVLD